MNENGATVGQKPFRERHVRHQSLGVGFNLDPFDASDNFTLRKLGIFKTAISALDMVGKTIMRRAKKKLHRGSDKPTRRSIDRIS